MTVRPLEGIRVLDLTQYLSGPFCTMTLSDLGAEVIKVERPPAGDPTREFAPMKEGASSYFVSCNRGKRSIALNLKDPKHKELFLKLVAKSDVVIENYKPGTMEKMGLSYETLKEAK